MAAVVPAIFVYFFPAETLSVLIQPCAREKIQKVIWVVGGGAL